MFEEYKDVVTVDEMSEMLRIGRSKAYEIVREKRILSIRVGTQIRIPKSAVINYLYDKPQDSITVAEEEAV